MALQRTLTSAISAQIPAQLKEIAQGVREVYSAGLEVMTCLLQCFHFFFCASKFYPCLDISLLTTTTKKAGRKLVPLASVAFQGVKSLAKPAGGMVVSAVSGGAVIIEGALDNAKETAQVVIQSGQNFLESDLVKASSAVAWTALDEG